MDTKEDQFTQRMLLRRSSIKLKETDQEAYFKSLSRRLNILKAIEDKGLQSGLVIDSLEKMQNEEEKIPEDKSKPELLKKSTGAVKKTIVYKSSSWAKAQIPLLETIESISSTSHESEESFTKKKFHPKRKSKSLKKKEENILIKEERAAEKQVTQIQKSYHPESMPDSNQVPLKDAMLKFMKNMQIDEAKNVEDAPAWQSNLGICMDSHSTKIELGTYNISDKSPGVSKNFSSSYNKTDHSYYPHKIRPEQLKFSTNDYDDLKFNKLDIHYAKPIRLTEDISIKSKEPDSNSSYITEDSIYDTSLKSYMKELEQREEKMQGLLSVAASSRRNDQFEDWRSSSEIFGKSVQEPIDPQLLTVKYKTTAVREKVSQIKTIDSNSEIEEASSEFQIRRMTSTELLKTVEETESGSILTMSSPKMRRPPSAELLETPDEEETASLFSLSSAINNLDEEIKNMEFGANTVNLGSVIETPKKHLPVTNVKTTLDYTPRTLFEKDPTNEVKEEKKSEHIGIVGKHKTLLKEVKSSLLRRHSSIFGFKTPKSWKPKPNMESTRKGSNVNLTKKTTSPSQAGSTLSSIHPNTPTTPELMENKKSPTIVESIIPYEVEQFLEEALGEELYNTSMTFVTMDMRNKTSNLNASELISNDKSPPCQNRQTKSPNIAPSKYNTLNRTISACKSMSHRIKKKLRPSLHEPVKQTRNPGYMPINFRLDERLQNYLQEINNQQIFIYQASKALDYCRSIKEFAHSPELVESDRLILIATLRKQALFQEIRNLSTKPKTRSSIEDYGEITVKDISVSLKEGFLRRERQNVNFVEWVLVVVSEGLTVWATHASNCPINSPKMYFPGNVSISRMKPDFKISVKVYSLKIPNITFNHEEKYRIQSEERNRVCPSPTKLLMRSERAHSPKIHEVKFYGMRDTSFKLTGMMDIELHDLGLTTSWPLNLVPNDSALYGTVDMSLSCKLHLHTTKSGFLTHGEEVGGFSVWNRRWCALKGHTMKFWNYPREEETKSPLMTINLMDSVTNLITSVERTLCAKPRTFCIETSRHRRARGQDSNVLEFTPAIVRYLLQCDNTDEFIKWMTKINDVLDVLYEWNVFGTKPLPEYFV